ncbi:hypothetical protein CHARACLAT_017015 [Characodon lateralis]|uniref:Uncharacterized protein n=1 Tax=Characodon lateralis TaxID=208331 RepID=A0ABU7EVG2_9TELE|nr:hypothetical protein [Characodon lateralis]
MKEKKHCRCGKKKKIHSLPSLFRHIQHMVSYLGLKVPARNILQLTVHHIHQLLNADILMNSRNIFTGFISSSQPFLIVVGCFSQAIHLDVDMVQLPKQLCCFIFQPEDTFSDICYFPMLALKTKLLACKSPFTVQRFLQHAEHVYPQFLFHMV